jgi:T4 superinfection immunity protein/putative oligomerization/nucleic acid binding protein
MFLDAGSGGAGSTALTLFVVAIYFIPTIVAIVGRHRRWLLIALINVLFGWTIIGWLVAVALLATRRRSEPMYVAAPPQAATAVPSTRAEQLEKLATLRERGALTEAEFAAEKAKLLENP